MQPPPSPNFCQAQRRNKQTQAHAFFLSFFVSFYECNFFSYLEVVEVAIIIKFILVVVIIIIIKFLEQNNSTRTSNIAQEKEETFHHHVLGF
jgi:L-asparagine transporter-like permease